jgi:hypothetical protein
MTVPELEKTLKSTADVQIELHPALETVRQKWAAQVKRSFAASVTPEGEAWQPRSRPSPRPLLIRSGDLVRAATAQALGAVVNDDSVRGKGKIPEYGYVQAAGSPSQNIPGREFHGLGDSVIEGAVEDGLAAVQEAALAPWK